MLPTGAGKVVRGRLAAGLPQLLLALGGLLIVLGVVGLLVGQKYLSTSQDTRSNASNPNGRVTVQLSNQSNSVAPGEPLTFSASINTHSVPTDGIQLVLILPKSAAQNITLVPRPNTGLQTVLNRVIDKTTVYELQLMAVPTTIGQPFTTNTDVPFLDIQSTANHGGTYQLTADQARSLSVLHGSDPAVDELQTVSPLSFTITGSPPIGATATPSPTPSTEPVVCDLTVPLGFAPSRTWVNPEQLQAKLQWQKVDTATGYRIYLVTPEAATAGQPYVIWNVLENNAFVSEDAHFAPIETDLRKESILPLPNSEGAMQYIWTLPTDNAIDRLGNIVKDAQSYRFLVYAFKVSDACHKQAAIGILNRDDITPPQVSSTLDLNASLQGLTRAGVNMPATVYLVPSAATATSSATAVPDAIDPIAYQTELLSGEGGTLKTLTPVELTDIEVPPEGTRYDILLKTPYSLRKKLGSMLLLPGLNETPAAWTDLKLLTGDFVQTPQLEWNRLNLLDIAAQLSVYTQLNVPVTATNKQFDVTFDGKIDILDIALVLSNYTALAVLGD